MIKTLKKLCARRLPKLDINTDDIDFYHRFRNKVQTMIKFGKRKVSRQVLSIRKELNKVKTSDIDLTGQSKLCIN